MKKPISHFTINPEEFRDSWTKKKFEIVKIKREEIDLIASLIHQEIIQSKDKTRIDKLRKTFSRLIY